MRVGMMEIRADGQAPHYPVEARHAAPRRCRALPRSAARAGRLIESAAGRGRCASASAGREEYMNEAGSTVALPVSSGAPSMDRLSVRRIGLRFTGSGSEYFRIWIVNLLLTLVTLGFYYPFAKVRRLRYFYANTRVGEHALGFHASPRKMLRGYLLVSLMFLLYAVAGRFSELAGLLALLIVGAIWPALLKSSLQFRLANTSWRGLRFRFEGSTGGAYRALLPLFVPALLLLAPLVLVPAQDHAPPWYGALSAIFMLAGLLMAPWLWWRLKKYQHDHCAFGPLQTGLQAGPGAFYGVFFKTIGVSLLALAIVGALAALVVAGGLLDGVRGRGSGRTAGPAGIAALVVFLIGLSTLQAVPGAYLTSRMQNLIWSRTGAALLRFGSTLRFRPLFALTLKNWLLLLLSLGLYWPFAAVAMARMRLEAVSLNLDLDAQALVESAVAREGEAAGDAAGDLFGLDIGL
jgi:uncharacterized membrane protein YjgN (DUF898 family)